MGKQNQALDPNRLTPAQAAKLLSAAAKLKIPVEQIKQDLADGAPTNVDGSLNLMHYAAWLAGEMRRGE